MDKTKALQKLLDGTATKKEIEQLRQALASGEISIGRDVNRSVVIIGSGNKVELTAEALGILNPEVGKEETAAEGEPPYMGLRYFDTSDAELFFGRETLSRELLERVKRESFLAIVGASGSGKSSVARAGLIPLWKQENERGAIHVITPTAHPLESLAASLTRESESIAATLRDLQEDSRGLRLRVRKLLSDTGGTNLLLLVDQFEETFTLCKDPAERAAFIKNLLAAADEDDGRVRMVITLRADFYHHCADYSGLPQVLQAHQAYITAMASDELREAITAPAKNNGWDFQPGLVDLILQDVGVEPGALPLLSHALLETWRRRQGHTLTLQGYADAGGVKKAIAQTAESVYDHLTPAEQGIARSIFLRLTELGEGTQDTRRRVKMDELGQAKEQDALSKVLKTLADARLVTTEQDSAEVAHEALIREWGTLRKWLDEDRESLRLHRHLTESAHEWQRRGREASELYRGARLKQLQDWLKEHGDALSPLEREFARASQKRKERESWQLAGVISLTSFLALMIYLAVIGEFNRFIYRPVDMDNYWVTIPAGEFQMGSEPQVALTECQKYSQNCDIADYQDEAPIHFIYLNAFEIGRYEVTNRQYAQCVGAGICAEKPDVGENKDSHPVVNVSWYDAQIFCDWIGGHLPTESEWEKAARGGLESKQYPWGDDTPTCTAGAPNGANFNAGKDCANDSMPVGSFAANGYGLYDMAGNVWEWVSSLYQPYPYNAGDGREGVSSQGDPIQGDRVLRGGAWYINGSYVRSASRDGYNPRFMYYGFGFRCARDIP